MSTGPESEGKTQHFFQQAAGTARILLVSGGLRAGRIELCLTSTEGRLLIKVAERPTEVQAGSISRHSTWAQLQHVEKCYYAVSYSNNASLIIPGRKWKTTHRRSSGQGLDVTCEQRCFKINQRELGRAPELKFKSRRRADTRLLLHVHLSCSMNLVPCLLHHLQRIQNVMGPCLAWCHMIPSHLLPKVRDEENRHDSWISHTEIRCDTVMHSSCRGRDGHSSIVNMDQYIPVIALPRTWAAHWEVSPDSFEKLQEITLLTYLALMTDADGKLCCQLDASSPAPTAVMQAYCRCKCGVGHGDSLSALAYAMA
ncbi:hypothetical protein GWK47_054795 [Chionoecetes opilio]|uniref:Uncharacterized protein n=1 Tax=Chionoecetes opilio TaxID=41210 RepID=A0A8J5C708_CHIOP|nr:hypothetical protein GWK47_054795 [Chionoecetes opilio]